MRWPWQKPAPATWTEALVAYVGNGLLVLNKGSRDGVRVGDGFVAAEDPDNLINIVDPNSHELIGRYDRRQRYRIDVVYDLMAVAPIGGWKEPAGPERHVGCRVERA